MYTGDKEHLRFALAAQQRVFDHHMLIDGIPSTIEDYRGITALDSHETCCIADHTWTWGYLLMATAMAYGVIASNGQSSTPLSERSRRTGRRINTFPARIRCWPRKIRVMP